MWTALDGDAAVTEGDLVENPVEGEEEEEEEVAEDEECDDDIKDVNVT